MKPIYRYRYPPYPYFLYRTDTDIPHIPHTHTNFFHADTDTGYWYLVSVPGIGIIPGIGRTLVPENMVAVLRGGLTIRINMIYVFVCLINFWAT